MAENQSRRILDLFEQVEKEVMKLVSFQNL